MAVPVVGPRPSSADGQEGPWTLEPLGTAQPSALLAALGTRGPLGRAVPVATLSSVCLHDWKTPFVFL